MSDAGGKKTWAGLIAIDQHKEALFAILRDAYERGPKSEPFNEDKVQACLFGVAQGYFDSKIWTQKAIPAADRRAQLQELAKALRRARTLTDKAMQNDDVGTDLNQAWWENECESSGRLDLGRTGQEFRETDKEFEKIVATLATLENAASRAAAHVPTAKRGRPSSSGRVLVWSLAGLYREATGLKPGAGDGPFAKFVMEFATALGDNIEYESVVDAIKDAKKLTDVRRAYGSLSPFD